jgi:hypothetical protein
MPNQTHGVIKSGDVMLAGRRPIGCAAECVSSRPAQAATRIVAEDASGATLEVVCSCGKRTYVRCSYRGSVLQPAAGQPGAAPDNQENPS